METFGLSFVRDFLTWIGTRWRRPRPAPEFPTQTAAGEASSSGTNTNGLPDGPSLFVLNKSRGIFDVREPGDAASSSFEGLVIKGRADLKRMNSGFIPED